MSAVSLYKNLLATAAKFDNYNFRSYFVRRINETYAANRTVTDAAELNAIFTKANLDANTLNRQASISQMYTAEKLVVEKLT
ncbi:hypothetical protein BABINDRAFT_161502 [Babjeviella inositovora NRRL Y-12698]|uniref:Complex 1 LYR protein domain-containing protein n=1 Tax=Babjeviella inositovora NRRL Y-12698 TaxID=984486 RepID=A0A1E3QQ39_9ASCO|nr:uncharacterized protein BABINDRAFT_161502 [Babjeviella inositovora NRRL Y-12698]ODQ79813.1 hypothetical protein BABINDRAFT_161502 [Babjeviella inositovora NRRL Y-12698]